MNCEYCSANIITKYGSGRFCSEKCARMFSSRSNKELADKKRSIKLIEYYKTHQNISKGKKWTNNRRKTTEIAHKARSKMIIENNIKKWNNNMDKKTARKLMIHIYGLTCQECGLNWINKYGNGPYQIHHIDGNSNNNDKKNLKLLCLNCHWKTDNFGFRGRKHNPESIEKSKLNKIPPETIKLVCMYCGKKIIKRKKYYENKIKHGQKQIFCSRRCAWNSKRAL